MNTKIALIIATTLTLGAGAALAGFPGKFTAIDTNEDGAISRAEADAKQDQFFEKADANKDGQLTKEEMRAFKKERRAEHLGDANGDGEITKAEFLARAEKRFDRLDQNDDGKISADELPKRGMHHGRR